MFRLLFIAIFRAYEHLKTYPAYRLLMAKYMPVHHQNINVYCFINIKMWEYGLDQAGSGQGQVAGTCECDNEPSVSRKCREFLD